jgi:hypothetical protein
VAVPVRRRVQHADIRRDGTPVDAPTETPTPENAP